MLTLSQALDAKGLRPDSQLRPYLSQTIRQFGKYEWKNLGQLASLKLDPASSRRLLGSGYALTEFLIAPMTKVEPDRDCSLLLSMGALVNLIVVICDQLIDAGVEVAAVIPRDEIAAGGGTSSPVMALLRQYSERLSEMRVDPGPLDIIRKVIARMFEAEAETAYFRFVLPYRFWLRKSALPFVLMALPAWSYRWQGWPELYRWHLRWLYGVGRFFGAVDDCVDLDEDSRNGHPNYALARAGPRHSTLLDSTARWGRQLLSQWDARVPRDSKALILREIFLHLLWGWAEPANQEGSRNPISAALWGNRSGE